jgi:hypothetical protein
MIPHLILHKVRGEPAFDVATQLDNGWWIIPTSGHRAYPCKTWRIDELYYSRRDTAVLAGVGHLEDIITAVDFNELPDHYANKLIPDLLTPTIRRRVATATDLDF